MWKTKTTSFPLAQLVRKALSFCVAVPFPATDQDPLKSAHRVLELGAMSLVYRHDPLQRVRKSRQNVAQEIVVQMDVCGSVIRAGICKPQPHAFAVATDIEARAAAESADIRLVRKVNRHFGFVDDRLHKRPLVLSTPR